MQAFTVKSAIAMAFLTLIPTSFSVANDEFRQFLQQTQSEYQEYKDKRDKEFTSFLKSHWKELDVYTGVKRDKAPKPVKMPVARPKPAPKPVVKPVPVKPAPVKPLTKPQPQVKKEPDVRPELIPAPKPKPTPQAKAPVTVKPVQIIKPPVVPVKPVVKPVVVPVPKGRAAKIDYFGQRLTFYYDPKMKTRLSGRINADSISGFWSSLSKADYDGLLEQLAKQRKPLQISDWSYALLINELAKSIYSGQKNEQSLFTWFMLIKSNYQARLAYSKYKVFLLLPTQQRLYSVSFFTFGGKRYYALGMDGNRAKPGKVFTYDGEYPGANKAFNMALSQNLNTKVNKRQRKVNFIYKNKRYTVDVSHDLNTINYLKTYPQMDIDQYFKSRVNASIGNPVLSQLRRIIKGKSEEEAVNILLLFVQNAFKYKTDAGQFGEENYLFPEETLFYPYSDCEDRSVIFAWLVRSLTGLEVVGLDYPGHIATAVKFNSNVSGDVVRHKGSRYVVADPTYINARAGMTMPNMKKEKPKVIKFRAY